MGMTNFMLYIETDLRRISDASESQVRSNIWAGTQVYLSIMLTCCKPCRDCLAVHSGTIRHEQNLNMSGAKQSTALTEHKHVFSDL
jgi:hypothetical protein